MAGKSRGQARPVPMLANPGVLTLVLTVYDGTIELESTTIDISIIQSESTATTSSRVTAKPLPADGVFLDAGSVGEDTSYVFGNTWVSMSDESISGVPGQYDESSLQSHRSGQAPFGYIIPGFQPNEPVEITMGFAETSFCTEGERVFDILVNDLSFMMDFDVFTTAGCNAALMVRGKTTATADGTLEISFLKGVQNPMVSFVSITRSVQADAVEEEEDEDTSREVTNEASNTVPVETTDAPSSIAPTTIAPTTSAPVTSEPSTSAPSTAVPTAALSDFPSMTPSMMVTEEFAASTFSAALVIDAGSPSDDRSIISGRVWVSGTEEPIGGIPRGIPMEMLQSHRTGRSPFMYTLDGFQPFGLANITLGFAEIFEPFCETGKRIFSVDINQVPLLSNIDVYGIVGCNQAFVVDGVFQADANGVFELTLTSIEENPMISLVAIDPLSPTQQVRSDGTDFMEASSSVSTSTLLITSEDDIGDVGVIMPNTTRTWTFPQEISNVPAGIDPAVFQTHRSASMFSYIFGGFDPYQPASISIGFAENYEPNCVATKRLFDIEVNEQEFQYDIDVFGSVGCNTALIITKPFDADENGMFAIDFYSVKRNPLVSLIAIDTEDSATPIDPTPQPSPLSMTNPDTRDIVQETAPPSSLSNQVGRLATSASPTSTITVAPTSLPTALLSSSRTASPSSSPTIASSSMPSDYPSAVPTPSPTRTHSALPSDFPSGMPSSTPSIPITLAPTSFPTPAPSGDPSSMPSSAPTVITAMFLVDAATTEKIAPITEGSTFDLSETGSELSILVETTAVGFVRFRYGGETQLEGAAPFVLGGKNAATRTYWPVTYLSSTGSKTIEIDAVLEDGSLGQNLISTFEITKSEPAPAPTTSAPTATPVILAVRLVDSITKEKIMVLNADSSYDLADVGSELSVLVETSSVGFVRFQYDGQVKTEGRSPYLMGGKMDTNDYASVPYLSYPGLKTIKIAAFHPDNYVLQRREISFTVKERSSDQAIVTSDSVVTPDAVDDAYAGSETGSSPVSVDNEDSGESTRASPARTATNSTTGHSGEGNNTLTMTNTTEEEYGDSKTSGSPVGGSNRDHSTAGSESSPAETNSTEDLLEENFSTVDTILIDAGAEEEDRSNIAGKNWASISKDDIMGVVEPYSAEVFQSHRSGYLFNYTLSGFAPNVPALLSLGFAENYEPYCQVNKRVFDVIVNGIDFERNLDVFRSAQDCFTALVITESVTSNANGDFIIEFQPVRGNPMLSLIDISVQEESTMSSSVAAPTPVSYINNVTLVNPFDRSVIMELQDGGTLDGKEFDEALSLVVDTTDGVASIRFKWNGLVHQEENSPYTMGGKSGSTELESIPYLSYPGEKTVIIELFDEGGGLLQTEEISFLIDDEDFFSESSVTTSSVPDTIINAGTEDEDPSMMDGSVWNSFFPDNITNVPDGLTMEYLKYHRSGYKFNYTLTGYTPGGPLDLSLVFAENYEPNCVTEKRLFDVVVNDEVLASNIDVYGAVGCFSGYTIAETVTADTDGSLHIQFLPVKRHPMVSAIIVSQLDIEPNDAPSFVPSDAPSLMPSLSIAGSDETVVGRISAGTEAPVVSPTTTTVVADPTTTESAAAAAEPVRTAGSYIAGNFLVNAKNRMVVKIINYGDVISLSEIGDDDVSLSIVVDVADSENVSHVRFRWAGQQKIEGRSPYAMKGKNSETGFNAVNYLSTPGAKSISITVFGLDQTMLEATILSFTVKE